MNTRVSVNAALELATRKIGRKFPQDPSGERYESRIKGGNRFSVGAIACIAPSNWLASKQK